MKIPKTALICLGLLLAAGYARAQSSGSAPPEKKPEKGKSFGNLVLRLGGELLGEVKRRLNLEEAEIVTVTKETLPTGGYKYHIQTSKFSVDIRKKAKAKK